VQDFYSHSNWVESHPRPSESSPFRTDTWFHYARPSENRDLFTGSYPDLLPGARLLHGDYAEGLNKDSYVRPHWAEAYVFAYAASREWVNAVHAWINDVNPAFWARAQRLTVSVLDQLHLDMDLEAAYRLSEWVKEGKNDGHWKGPGSGSASDFLSFAVDWTRGPDSPFVSQFKRRGVHRLLSNGLTGDVPPASTPPNVPRITVDRRAVVIRTLQVVEDGVDTFESRIDPRGKADFYARITVVGQTFLEAMQLDRSDISPSWTTIKFVPTSTTRVTIHYELWDEDTGLWVHDDLCDIIPARDKRRLDFGFAVSAHTCAGDISGIHDTGATAFSSKGARPDSDRAVVRFYVTEQALKPVVDLLPGPIWP
jgi:hypothetical protein